MFSWIFCFIDSTEQPVPRPTDKDRRKTYYSGKKKRHMVKNQFMINNHGYILHKIDHKKRRRRDYDVDNENHPITPKQVLNIVDLGYLGVEKDFPQQMIHTS
jgi:hypothetical protein